MLLKNILLNALKRYMVKKIFFYKQKLSEYNLVGYYTFYIIIWDFIVNLYRISAPFRENFSQNFFYAIFSINLCDALDGI